MKNFNEYLILKMIILYNLFQKIIDMAHFLTHFLGLGLRKEMRARKEKKREKRRVRRKTHKHISRKMDASINYRYK